MLESSRVQQENPIRPDSTGQGVIGPSRLSQRNVCYSPPAGCMGSTFAPLHDDNKQAGIPACQPYVSPPYSIPPASAISTEHRKRLLLSAEVCKAAADISREPVCSLATD